MFGLIREDIENWAGRFTEEEPGYLKKLNRETWAEVPYPRMLAGRYQGRLISLISHLVQPTAVLDIGTYTGYSAMCWAEGLASGGQVISVDINEEYQSRALKHIKSAGLQDKVQLICGDAMSVIESLDLQFDIVYIDADKHNYSAYYDGVFPKVRENGLIICDNVYWSGKAMSPEIQDSETQAIRECTEHINKDPRVQNILLTVRDGWLIARKKCS